jgi:ankyrin repeat protein
MPPPKLPLEILLMIARLLVDDEGKLCFADFNSYLQVNRVLYGCLNRTLWQEAVEVDSITHHVFAHLIQTNDSARLKFFLELGAEVETILQDYDSNAMDTSDRWGSGNTPLKVAAQLDIVPMARLLLEHGADLVQYDLLERPSYSAIHAARSAEMVLLLLDHHADPEQQFGNGLRPLHFYAERDNIEAMRALLRNGVEVDPSGGTPTPLPTPLHYAAVRNRVGAVKLLLEYGADVKRKKGFVEDTPLHLAAKEGKTDMARLLLERWPEGIREKNGDGHTPLHFAAQAGKADLVKLLLERWPEATRERDVNGNRPLHLAARYIGMTGPLHLAARCWEIDTIRLLVESWPEGKDVQNVDGMTPWLMLGRRSQFEFDQWPWRKAVALLGGVY